MTSPICRLDFDAIKTPPCGSFGLSLRCKSYPSWLVGISDDFIPVSSQVSVPMMMSGFESSITHSSSFPLLRRL